ncbi:amidohydrolase 2 [Meredithblackwellia eburnea MCA 4105]
MRSEEQAAPPHILVDSHTHVLPNPLASKIRNYFVTLFDNTDSAPDPIGEQMGCCGTEALEEGVKPSFPYTHDPDQLLKVLEEETAASSKASDLPSDQKSVSWVLPYAHRAGIARGLNKSTLELCLSHNAKPGIRLELVPGLTVHPDDGETEAESCVREAVRNGARVVKLHCSVGDYSVMDERLKGFFALAQRAKLPVVVHAGKSVFGTAESHDLSDISKLCAKYPKLPVILAHSGWPASLTALTLASKHANLYLDTTPVLTYCIGFPFEKSSQSTFASSLSTPATPETLLHLLLTNRILFGSDVPTVTRSREDIAQNMRQLIRNTVIRCVGKMHVEDVREVVERFSEKAEKAVFGEAALELMKGVVPEEVDRSRL